MLHGPLCQQSPRRPVHQRADRAQVGLHASRKYQRSFFANKLGQPSLSFDVQLERAVEKAAARATRAILLVASTAAWRTRGRSSARGSCSSRS